ncbi:MAG: hypothetical protein JW750_11780 [Anaerolineaceae bacterium]|nr:hypothetical protein [Anaerolineaceae bacterium]
MGAKLIMTWDIQPEREREYFEFVIREFLPGVQNLGLELTDAWATVYGDRPQIQVGAISDSIDIVRGVLRSEEWDELESKLLDYVVNYHHKVVNQRKGFQF